MTDEELRRRIRGNWNVFPPPDEKVWIEALRRRTLRYPKLSTKVSWLQDFPKERYDEMMAAYQATLPRFATGRDKTRPRNEWCRESLYNRAKQVQPDRIMLYRSFYGQASSLHHLDFAGLAASSADDHLADMAPSWKHLSTALTAIGCAYRSVVMYDEMANMGFKAQLEEGPGVDYLAACKGDAPD